jgi:hypothetical protein
MDKLKRERREEALQRAKKMSKQQLARLKSAKKYVILVGVELFSRYGFVRLFEVFNPFSDEQQTETLLTEELSTDIDKLPSVDKASALENVEEDGLLDGLGGKGVVRVLQEWFAWIKKKGFHVSNLVSDNGSEFTNLDVEKFLDNEKVHHVFSVANDRVANPIAESFIRTFKRIFGQYIAMKNTIEINQKDVDEMVEFYNDRIHSSTGYSPMEVLFDDGKKNNQDMLTDLYRAQKNTMYFHLKDDIPVDTYIRIFKKYKIENKALAEYRSNEPNWSYTIFKIAKKNLADNMYRLKTIHDKLNIEKQDLDTRERNKLDLSFTKSGLRSYFLKVLDYPDFQKYN